MLRKAIVLSFDAQARTALVEYWGDTERRAESVGVAAHVDAAMLAGGAAVEVWSPADSRPDEALIVASRAAPTSPDQTIAASHDRLDNLFGPGSLASQWYNRLAVPSSPDSHDTEMTESPIGSNGWAWQAEPGSASSSGWSMTTYPHFMYVWQSIWASPNPAELRCTDTGNLPRNKSVILFFYPSTTAVFSFRSVKDSNNYIEVEMSSAGIKGYKCIGGSKSQVGSTVPLYPFPYVLTLSNHASADYLTWQWGNPWGPGYVLLATDTSAGLRAGDIDHVSLQFTKGTVNFEVWMIDAVRFSA